MPDASWSRTREKFILTASFSKTWAMTGFRVGYTISSEETISKMISIQSLLLTSVPEFIQYGAIKALDESDPDVAQNAADDEGEDRGGQPGAGQACRRWSTSSPTGRCTSSRRRGRRTSTRSAFTMKLLEEKGVTISPGTGFGDYPRAFRISLGGSERDDRRRDKEDRGTPGLKVAVIGSSGGMGKFFARYFLSHGNQVTGSDKRRRPASRHPRFRFAGSNAEAVKDADVVVDRDPNRHGPSRRWRR